MIEVRNLTKSFGEKHVLHGVDLCIDEGETMVVLGRSGSGKSVILKHLIGLMKPDAGEVLVDGESIADLPERKLTEVRRKVGMLFQSGALFDSMTVEQNLAFPLLEQGMRDKTQIADRVAEALDMVDLAGEQRKMPAELSGGMRKRVGLARTIVGRSALHPLRRTHHRPRPDHHGRHQSPDPALAAPSESHLHRSHPRYENRISLRRSRGVPPRRTPPFHRHGRRTPGQFGHRFDRLHRRPQRGGRLTMSDSAKGTEWKVGLFVVIGLAVITIMAITFGKVGSGLKKFYSLTVEFQNASGLLKGNDVYLAGDRVGYAEQAPSLIEGKFAVSVPLRIREGVKIPKSSKFLIGSSGLMGDAYVSIEVPPDANFNEVFKDGDFILGSRVKGPRGSHERRWFSVGGIEKTPAGPEGADPLGE
jgi:ABC-type ATPase involved in cell division